MGEVLERPREAADDHQRCRDHEGNPAAAPHQPREGAGADDGQEPAERQHEVDEHPAIDVSADEADEGLVVVVAFVVHRRLGEDQDGAGAERDGTVSSRGRVTNRGSAGGASSPWRVGGSRTAVDMAVSFEVSW